MSSFILRAISGSINGLLNFLDDNSLTKDFSEYIKTKGFKCINITDEDNKDSVLKRLALSHELC